jgi:hypothetical protein
MTGPAAPGEEEEGEAQSNQRQGSLEVGPHWKGEVGGNGFESGTIDGELQCRCGQMVQQGCCASPWREEGARGKAGWRR